MRRPALLAMTNLVVPDSIAHLASIFSLTLVSRGSKYFDEGRYRIESMSGFEAELIVVGQYEYFVQALVRPAPGDAPLMVDCTCPYFQREHVCKHVWCALLALHHRAWPGLLGPKVRLMDANDDDDWEVLDEEPLEESFSRVIEARRDFGYSHLRRQFELVETVEPPATKPVYLITPEPHGLSLYLGRLTKKGRFQRIYNAGPFRNACEEPSERAFLYALGIYGTSSSDILESLGELLPLLAREQRLFIEGDETEVVAVSWTEELARVELLAVASEGADGKWSIRGTLHWGAESHDIVSPSPESHIEPVGGNCAIRISAKRSPCVFRFASTLDLRWFQALSRNGPVTVRPDEQQEFLSDQLERGSCTISLPAGMKIERQATALRKILRLRDERGLRATVSFRYAEQEVDWSDDRHSLVCWEDQVALQRDHEGEARVPGELAEAGLSGKGLGPQDAISARGELRLKKALFPSAVTHLVERGWDVYGENGRYRTMSSASTRVSSGKDWFDLHGRLEFEDQALQLPDLVRALKKRALDQRFVRLDDGSMGLLPESWIQRLERLQTGTATGDVLRFSLAQVGVVDELTSGTQHERDAQFEKLTQLLVDGGSTPSLDLPPGFAATLRPYQQHGVAWLLQRCNLGLGACLADDMGLGKTIQVLALFHTRSPKKSPTKKTRRAANRPRLVVAPRSVVDNWASEAARFCPHFDVTVHLGSERARDEKSLKQTDIIVTSFATLRLDAELFTSMHFDTIVIDEAQNLKNASTVASKVTKALKGDVRIALTGTPIENNLGDLWSIFDFLNPGMLSYLGKGRKPPSRLDGSALDLLKVGVRPFLLRRTKDQVAPDLPQRTEQAWRLELSSAHRRLYDDMAEHYRTKIAAAQKRRSKELSPLILEALMRLRQAACDPRLLDDDCDETGVKLQSVCDSIATLREEGRKALVFSQFTSLLKLLATELGARDIPHEYLDGATTRRSQVVQRFREADDCSAFLISLKAGGVGLNLTEADTVFLLDPWWNPAAEAQAIDRTHRIGQEKPVFAWRLIARDTIEEKVLDLQDDKRDLARAVLDGKALSAKLSQKEMLALLE